MHHKLKTYKSGLLDPDRINYNPIQTSGTEENKLSENKSTKKIP